ncbi:hypothetical protein ACHAPJ_013385, partial [Fusarium lateritium]
ERRIVPRNSEHPKSFLKPGTDFHYTTNLGRLEIPSIKVTCLVLDKSVRLRYLSRSFNKPRARPDIQH